jgi:hypothetical protein
VSNDPEDTASATVVDKNLKNIAVGYGLTREDIASCNLFASQFERGGKSLFFAEPAQWLVLPDGRLYASIQASISCGRPDLPGLLRGIGLLIEQGLPIRGDA